MQACIKGARAFGYTYLEPPFVQIALQIHSSKVQAKA